MWLLPEVPVLDSCTEYHVFVNCAGGDTGTTVHVAGGSRRNTPHSRYRYLYGQKIPENVPKVPNNLKKLKKKNLMLRLRFI